MALKEKFMVKQVYGNTDFELTADPGESLLVKDIFVYNPATAYVTIKVGKTTVGYFRVGGNLGSHLPLPIGSLKHSHGIKVGADDGNLSEDHALTDAYGAANAHIAVFSDRSSATTEDDIVQFGSIPLWTHKTILGLLRDKGIFNGYPVPEGYSMTITGAKQAGSLVMVFYEVYDAGDITETDINGPKATEYLFINYGRVAANVTSTGDTIYSTSANPAEFPDFPFGKDVPAMTEIELIGILASDVVDDRGSNDSMNTEYLKLIKERTVLFDEDRNGLLLKGLTGTTDGTAQIARGLSVIGNYSDTDGKPPLFFDPPLKFAAGEELGVYITTTAGSSQSASDLLIADLEVGLIERVKRTA